MVQPSNCTIAGLQARRRIAVLMSHRVAVLLLSGATHTTSFVTNFAQVFTVHCPSVSRGWIGKIGVVGCSVVLVERVWSGLVLYDNLQWTSSHSHTTFLLVFMVLPSTSLLILLQRRIGNVKLEEI